MKINVTTPPGLLAVRDLIDRHPDSREEILTYEIRRRERELLLFRSSRKLLQVHVWGAVKTMLAVGLSVFVFAWTVGAFAGLAQWVRHAQQTSVSVPIPFAKEVKWDVGALIPTSTVLAAAAHLPLWDLRDAGMFAIAAILIVLIEKCIIAFMTWRQTRQMNEAEKDLEKELEALDSW